MSSNVNVLSPIAVGNLLETAVRKCPDIAFGMMLQAYVGLRCTEVCGLRSEYHPEGGSIKFDANNIFVTLGLRTSRVPEEYAETVKAAYAVHMTYIKSKCIDTRHPLFINTNGTALSTDRYIRRVKAFGNYILNSDNTKLLEVKGYLFNKNGRFTSDILRHWYEISIMPSVMQLRKGVKQ